ncbi:MAG: TrkA family potassium uptake protein [Bacteroidetes bacterium]|nr:TrkA family potassium uptake protein [Bacteroidota bacterium]MBL0052380.1 TrkA family potassium uptake protein [Bacteroidota bacterium]
MGVSKFAVIGLGRFGNAIARTLSKRGAEVIAIDTNEEYVELIKEEVAYAVTLDATDIKALKSQNLQDMDAVIVSIGEDFEALMLCTVLLMEIGVTRIMARANGKHQRMILEKIGIVEILSPENDVGLAVAERLLNPSILTTLMLPDDYEIVEVKTPRSMVNRSISDINLRNKYNLNLITIKRQSEEQLNGSMEIVEHILGVPSSDTVILESDTIILFGMAHDIERFLQINI